MNSSILHFSCWIAALVALLAIESTIYVAYNPHEFDRTNLLEFSFASDEAPQRLFMYHKIRDFSDTEHLIVQSGDSSGFHGIEPKIVMEHLPEGVSFLNMSCCANLGFSGYFNVFKLMIERNPEMKYFILHITPYTMPRPETWDGDGAALWGPNNITVFGDAIYDNFISPARVLHLPTMAYRREVTDMVYYLDGYFNELDRPLLINEHYLNFLDIYKNSLGWMPEADRRVVVPETECDMQTPEFFDLKSLSYKTYIEEVFEAYGDLARDSGVQLVIVFQPVACVLGTGEKNRAAREAVERFAASYTDVEIPFPLIESWPTEMFSVPAHVKREHTDLLGNRLGEAMAEIIERRGR